MGALHVVLLSQLQRHQKACQVYWVVDVIVFSLLPCLSRKPNDKETYSSKARHDVLSQVL